MPNNNWQLFDAPNFQEAQAGGQINQIPVNDAVLGPAGYNQAGGIEFNALQNYYVNYQKEQEMFKKSKTTMTSTGGPSASQLSDEYLALTSRIEELKGSLVRESEELASALEKIATQVEVVRDIGSLVQSRISNLQKAASQLERWKSSLPQPSSPGSLQELSAGHYAQVQALQPVQVGQVQVGPGLVQQGQE